jgi:pSer/pThr/pTyr-binding forkhead associated (FHA) protein
MPKLLLKHEGVTLNTYELDKDTITIGRKSDNDIQLNDAVASSHHAKITIKPNAYMEEQLDAQLDDLNSTNGTQVNNCNINSVELRNGDVIQVGSHHFIFESDDNTGMESTAIFLPDEE